MKVGSLVRGVLLGWLVMGLPSCALLRSWIYKEPVVSADPAPGAAQPEPDGEEPVVIRTYAETPTAKWTDDVPNTVWSPYRDGKKVAVDGIAPGTLVADPTCPEPMKALFYVPELP